MASSDPPVAAAIEPGTKLDRYELLCVLAHGGMANVWLARVQNKLGITKLCAVKTILPNVADDPSFKAMFLDEARIASRIEHPNVVHMIDVGDVAGIAYLVMDLVEGEPLYRLPRACEKLGLRIPLGVVLRILADACHGLHAAHELRDDEGHPMGVVHRDMSPQNILVSAAGVSKVIDFGVAKARERSTAATSAGTLKGKISYMPREQAVGQEVDRRADTWALGAVLYYLLAGRPPYKEENQLATLQLAMNAAPIPALPQTIPSALRNVVMRALSHEPTSRYQTAAEMGDALENLMRKLGVVTTHNEVGAFVQKVLGDKLDARRQLVASAMSEASNRERAREALTVPVDVEGLDDGGSHPEGMVAMPPGSTPRMESLGPPSSPTGSQPRGAEPSAPGPGTWPTGSTGGTFVAPPVDTRASHSRKWPIALAAAAMAVLAIAGGTLILVSFRGRATSAKVSSVSALPVETAAIAVSVTIPPAEVASAIATADPKPDASAAPSASASAAPRRTFQWTAPPPPPDTKTKPKPKKRDDEAGF